MQLESIHGPRIHGSWIEKIHYACQQSAYAVLRELQVTLPKEAEAISNLRLELTADPPFLAPRSWLLERLSPGDILQLQDRDIQLHGGLLRELTEAVQGWATLTLYREEEKLAEEVSPVTLLAYNEWGGAGTMPELLAAFSMPNDPAVDRILHDAGNILRLVGKPAGLDGYDTGNRSRVWEVASAIYAAIAHLGITYSQPPASFEERGQKIRFPGQLLDGRVGTCLDTTMLFASAIEQAGLNPLVVLPEGHAIIGVWLQPMDLATVVIQEAEPLRKAVQLQDLLLIETTALTGGKPVAFSRAVAMANEAIAPELDGTFHSVVDIRRARMHHILPLGSPVSPSIPMPAEAGSEETVLFEEAPPLPGFDDPAGMEELPVTPAGRLDRWQRKLLDLSARNPLLNYRAHKRSLPLICPNPASLEDALAGGGRLSIKTLPTLSSDGPDAGRLRLQQDALIVQKYALDALDKRQVLVDLPDEELVRRCVEIFRATQTALQEGGTNTLFLAFGFLLWKRSDKDDRRFRAPLILVPVGLERKSVRGGIRLTSIDDEPRMNTTLLEMLRRDFHLSIPELEGDLPQDDSGIDVNGIWQIVRRAVRDLSGCEVVEEVVLGHFSFAKYLMWKDLVDRTKSLRENRIVRHLLDSPDTPLPSGVAFVEGKELDTRYRPSDLLTPLPVDSSQLAAVASADLGKNFILIGPPGTGKSQTISNMIAHLLGQGKTVLFVSEKSAALEVVARRLQDVGLGRFCLELHSNKAKKAEVLAQLRRAWEQKEQVDDAQWQRDAVALEALRAQLNRLVTRLHLVRRNGMTVHHAMGVKVRDAEWAKLIPLQWVSPEQHDAGELDVMRAAVERLAVQFQALRGIPEDAFALVQVGEWSPKWESELMLGMERLGAAASGLDAAQAAFFRILDLQRPERTTDAPRHAAALARALLGAYRNQSSYALEGDGPWLMEALESAAGWLRQYHGQVALLSCPYAPMAWKSIDGHAISQHWAEANATWWPKKWVLKQKVLRQLLAGGALATPDPFRDGQALAALRTSGETIEKLGESLSRFRVWQGFDTVPQHIETLLQSGQAVRKAIIPLAVDAATLQKTQVTLHRLIQEANELLSPETSVGAAAVRVLEALAEWDAAMAAHESHAGESVSACMEGQTDALAAVRLAIGAAMVARLRLRDWCGWLRRRQEALSLDLAPVVKALEEGRVAPNELTKVFEAAYCTWWSGAVMGEDAVLRLFSAVEHEDALERYRALDTQFQRLVAQQVGTLLSSRIPGTEDVKRTSAWGLLQRELQKKTRHKPIRRLISEIPEVLTTLAPCMMMSPLSVAQYLPPEQALFDVVIFDEASQITVWDAVGTLARARQAVVAGDPKQMPPTNFFSRSEEDPDGEMDMEGDLESILDEMLAAGIPQCTLNLHYRSRRESLIAFSNSRYYDSSLVTFPAPFHPDKGVRLVHVDGRYERGRERHNEPEARAVVADILERLTHEDPAVRNRSIGVVTFNVQQQTLIENLLDEARSANPDIEWAFSRDSTLEPVFVKNLETVQGDERDVILFSITFGPDRDGHVTMNFGPLNRSGGERRLNVALTRARTEMVVYSSMRPEQIALSRTGARAVADLKHFLEYAGREASTLGHEVPAFAGEGDSALELAVAEALRGKGWTVHPQVGVSQYRVDLGIAHPDQPGRYLAGVECDGPMYRSAANACERDKVRQSVLMGLGWNLLRTWSADWWTNPDGALDRLDSALRMLLKIKDPKNP